LSMGPLGKVVTFKFFLLSTLTNIHIYDIYHIQHSHNTYISHPKRKCRPTLHHHKSITTSPQVHQVCPCKSTSASNPSKQVHNMIN
jgi:hypothetical protein